MSFYSRIIKPSNVVGMQGRIQLRTLDRSFHGRPRGGEIVYVEPPFLIILTQYKQREPPSWREVIHIPDALYELPNWMEFTS